MKYTNLLSEILISIFAVISYVFFTQSIDEGETIMAYTASLIYIMPQLVNTIMEFSTEHLTNCSRWIDLLAMSCGSLLMIFIFINMKNEMLSIDLAKIFLALGSFFFVVRQLYRTVIEVQRHNNVQKSLLEGR